MFKQKLEKIDFNYLTWHNMLKVYERYQQAQTQSSDRTSESEKASLLEQYRILFSSMMQILEVISA
jgi:hypothetical protein